MVSLDKFDIQLIDFNSQQLKNVLPILLCDRTTEQNIIWTTNAYKDNGFTEKDQITMQAFYGNSPVNLQPRARKSKEEQLYRTRAKAEVFTPSWLCNQMNNYADTQWFGRNNVFNTQNNDHTWTVNENKIEFSQEKTWQDYVFSCRLEITCGEAPYLVSRYDTITSDYILPIVRRIGLLDRKLRVVNENTKTQEEWTEWAIKAFENCYGFEYQGDSLLIARINFFLTFIDYYTERWKEEPQEEDLLTIANIISWNLWQMDGLLDTIPFGRLKTPEDDQMDLFNFEEPKESPTKPCIIKNWKDNKTIEYKKLKLSEGYNMGKKMFDFVIGNPPYQKESLDSVSKSNGQKPMTNIFQYFQNAADELTENTSVLIYPGGRWIHQAGKGMQNFGKNQINDKSLSVVKFYPDASELFGNLASLSDGITIVVKNHKKKTDGFTYIYAKKDEGFSVHADNPGDNLMPLDPHDLPIEQKINIGMKKYGLSFLHDAILPRSLFPIESDFVENNPSKVRKYDGFDKNIDFATEIKLFTNDKAGKAGRATWFVANRDVITRNAEYISQWQVVVSSANAGGQKRDNQLELIDNHSAFGRSRLALSSFNTYEEAKNFYDYARSYFIRYAFLLTDEALTSLGKKVPDLRDYTDGNPFINFKKDIDIQLCQLFNISDGEFFYMKNRVTSLRGEA